MKLNLYTDPHSVISTLKKEWKMAEDAYIKYKGGVEAYDKWQDTQLEKASMICQGFVGDIFTWVSPDGNKWCVFEDVTYDSLSTYSHTCNHAFCYYETIPFAGIFLHVQARYMGEESTDGAMVYESHFFERLNERGIMKWEGLKTLVAFVKENHASSCYCTNIETNQVDVRLKGCIGRGWAHRDCAEYKRIKTILSDEQLTIRQRKTTMQGRRWGDAANKYIDLPYEESAERFRARYAVAAICGKEEEFIQEQIRDFARVNMISLEEAETFYMHTTCILNIIFTIKPSLASKDVEFYKAIVAGAANIKAEWDENHDDEGWKKKLIESILKISKDLRLDISKQAIIKTMYKLTKISNNGN